MNRQVLKLAIPSILANITIPLVGLVDTAIAGHISDASAIGGIAVGTMLFDLLYWNFAFLRVGTGGMTAQAYGENKIDDCGKLFVQSMGLAGAGAMLILLIQCFFITAALALVPCSAEVATFTYQYFFIRIWAAPATLSLMAFKGWFIGMQNTVCPMICDMVVNIINIIVSYTLAVHTPLGAIGVAWGTVVAQYSGLMVAIGLLLYKYRLIFAKIKILPILRDISNMRRLLMLNGNLILRSLCFLIIYVGYTSLASSYGDTDLAVSSILMKLFMLFSYLVDGFAYAGEALVGRYFGERNKTELSKVVRVLFCWSVGLGAVFSILYAFLGDQSIRLMTSDQLILQAARPYLPWLIAMPIVSTIAFMWDGIYVGATAGKDIRNAMIYAALGFVMGYICCFRFVGAQAIYIGYFMHLIARVVYLTLKWDTVKNNHFIEQTI